MKENRFIKNLNLESISIESTIDDTNTLIALYNDSIKFIYGSLIITDHIIDATNFLPNVQTIQTLIIKSSRFPNTFLKQLQKVEYLIIEDCELDENSFPNLTIDNLEVSHKQNKNFLVNHTSIKSLKIKNQAQDPDFLRNLEDIVWFSSENVLHDKNFLRNCNRIAYLKYIDGIEQHPQFLRNLVWSCEILLDKTNIHPDSFPLLKSINNITLHNIDLNDGIFKNVESVRFLNITNVANNKNLLSNLRLISGLYIYDTTLDDDFLPNITALNEVLLNNVIYNKPFKNIKAINSLYFDNTINNFDWVETIGSINIKNHTTKKYNAKIVNRYKEPYIINDGILSYISNKRTLANNYVIYLLNDIYEDIQYYMVTDGENVAHGNSLKICFEDLEHKRDKNKLLDKYKGMCLSDVVTYDDAINMYRDITGACRLGVNFFLSNIIKHESYSISEIIDITENQYGNLEFKKFFTE